MDTIGEKLQTLERRRRIRQTGLLVLVLAVGAAAFLGLRFIQFNHTDLLRQVPKQVQFVQSFFPPNFADFSLYSKQNETYRLFGIEYSTSGLDGVLASLLNPGTILASLMSTETTLLRLSAQTVILGFTGTVLGFPLALLFGVLGSERVTPFPFNFIFRGTMSAIRAIPALVWILIYIPLAGINPVGAVLAITTDTIGNMGRLFTDELEEIDEGPIEAIKSTGGSSSQVIGFGMLSQVASSFVAWALYILEINVRIAISLGVVGAGGIGRYIKLRQQLFQYQEAAAGIVMVFIIVLSVELFSSRIRARLRPDEHESKGFVDALREFFDPNKWIGRPSKD